MKKILIVEDDPISSMSIKVELENAGYMICDIANSGEKTIESVKKNLPDLILMDISLSGEMDGIKTAQILNKDYEIPVIYLTGNSDISLFDRAKLTTPYGYIVKPVKTSELLKNISMCLINHDLKNKLRESEKNFRNLTENSSDIIFKTIDNEVIYCSPSTEKLLGYKPEEIIGLGVEKIAGLMSIELLGNINSGVEIFEVKLLNKSGEIRYFEINLSKNVNSADNGLNEQQGSARDVTKKIILQNQKNFMNEILQLLNSSGTKHETIIDVVEKISKFLSIDDIILRIKDGEFFPVYSAEGYSYSTASQEDLCRLKISRESIAGKVASGNIDSGNRNFTSAGSFFSPDFQKYRKDSEQDNLFENDIKTGCFNSFKSVESLAYIPLKTENKIIGFLELRDPRKNKFDTDIINFIEGIAGSIASAVVRKQISEKLEKSLVEKELLLEKERILIEKERLLQNRIIESIQDERRKIGQDLHDGLGQNLTAIAFLSQAMYKKLSTDSYLDPKYIEKINSIIQKSIIQTKMLSRLLYPIELEEYNFIDAIVNMASNVSKLFEVNCKVIYHDKIPDLPQDINTNLYYITSEAVTNAIKHGNSKNIDIIIDTIDNVLNITVSDDGTGVNVNAETANGFGIKSMKYRAQAINAKFCAENNAEKGFSIALKMEI
ncbi:MAG: response regulator [Spirochaetes bacterium]|nr:response regulator [Spirochaetota bacterium]